MPASPALGHWFPAVFQHAGGMEGVGVTLLVNWAIKPFSMALLGWLFIRMLFAD